MLFVNQLPRGNQLVTCPLRESARVIRHTTIEPVCFRSVSIALQFRRDHSGQLGDVRRENLSMSGQPEHFTVNALNPRTQCIVNLPANHL